MSVHVLMFESGDADEAILQELFLLLSERTDLRVMDLPKRIESSADSVKDVLNFPGLEINIKEQTVYKNGELVPLSHYEFFTLCFLARHPRWVYTK